MGMATASARTAAADLIGVPAGTTQVTRLLRLEGLAVAAVAAVLFARTGASWWLFAGVWLVPDLSLLGYLAGPRWGARIYNAIHSYVTPGTLWLCSLGLHSEVTVPYALIWINHIGVDRLLGFGLKYAAGFGFTHLSLPGKLGGAKQAKPGPC